MKRLTWELMDILVFPPACHKQPPWGFHVGCIHCISLNLLLAFPTISPQFLSKKPMLYPCCTVLGWVIPFAMESSLTHPQILQICSLYVSYGTDEETLFNHLQLLQLGIISFICMTLMFDPATRLPENKMQVTLTC